MLINLRMLNDVLWMKNNELYLMVVIDLCIGLEPLDTGSKSHFHNIQLSSEGHIIRCETI